MDIQAPFWFYEPDYLLCQYIFTGSIRLVQPDFNKRINSLMDISIDFFVEISTAF